MEPLKAVASKILPTIARTPATTLRTPGPASGESASKGPMGEERRRSQRVLLRVRAKVHVALNGTPTTFDVTTLSVNSHGGLIAVQQSLPTDTRLVLEHDGTKERMSCRVVRPPRETAEGFHTAIEFDSSDSHFWLIAFPPANWSPEDAES